MKIKVVPRIKAKGYPVGEPGYKKAHIVANTEEKKTFGARKYAALKKVIDKRIPFDELAGSHTKRGTILISEKIPKKYHDEIVIHEKTEHARMVRKKRVRKGRKVKRR